MTNIIYWQLPESTKLLFKIIWADPFLKHFISSSKSYDKMLILLLNLWQYKFFFPKKKFYHILKIFSISLFNVSDKITHVYTINNM